MQRGAALDGGAVGLSTLIALEELLNLLVDQGCSALHVGAGGAALLGIGPVLGNLLLRVRLLLGRETGLLLWGGLLLAHRQILI